MHPDLLSQIRSRAQEGIGRRMFDQAEESDRQLRELGAEIATACGCAAVFGTLKDRGRAAGKVANEKAGDWFGLTDVVRMTILAPDETRLRQVRSAVRARCAARHGLGLIRDFEQRPEASPCGYSGLLFVVRLPNGHAGEIQANLPSVLYGQFGETRFRTLAGDEAFERIRVRYQVDGGVGHPLYEIHRSRSGSDLAARAAALSRRYFDHLRGLPDPVRGLAVQREIESFRRAQPSLFLR